MNSKLPLLAALATVAVIGLTGCGSSSDAATPAPSSAMSAASSMNPSSPMMSMSSSKQPGMAKMVMITIKNFAYMGATTVKPGTMILVTNNDSETHTLTSDQAGLFTVNVEAGSPAMFNAPTKPGTYSYHCDFHSNMHGTLTVS